MRRPICSLSRCNMFHGCLLLWSRHQALIVHVCLELLAKREEGLARYSWVAVSTEDVAHVSQGFLVVFAWRARSCRHFRLRLRSSSYSRVSSNRITQRWHIYAHEEGRTLCRHALDHSKHRSSLGTSPCAANDFFPEGRVRIRLHCNVKPAKFVHDGLDPKHRVFGVALGYSINTFGDWAIGTVLQ